MNKDPGKKDLINNILRWGGTVVTLGLFLFLLQKQDWKVIWESVTHIPWFLIVCVWLLFVLRMVVNAMRWFILLQIADIKISMIESIKLVFLGLFVSNFLPSTIGGDGVRFLGLLQFEKDRTLALASIVLDRLVNVFAMLSLLPVSFLVFQGKFLDILGGYPGIQGVTGALIPPLKRLLGKLRHWAGRFKLWLESPEKILTSLLFSWIAVFIYFFGVWLIAINLGIDIRLIQVTGITVITYLITLLPISVNGYGVREVAITSLYSSMGASMEQALSLAIITRLLYLTTSLIGAVWLPRNISGLWREVSDLRDTF